MKPTDRRVAPRFRVQFRTTLSPTEAMEGIGIIEDLSVAGCRIKSDVPVQWGLPVELRIHVPELRWPLMIDKAQVQWLRGDTFGLAFVGVKDNEQQRLDEVITALMENSVGKDNANIADCVH
jgi:hypothetical protein